MKIIGYMQGTDPQVLTQLLLEGYETYPLSNVFDNHGKNITLVKPYVKGYKLSPMGISTLSKVYIEK